MIERYKATRNGKTELLHRCTSCWLFGPHADSDNGFIPASERIVHAQGCPEAKLRIVVPSEGASEEVKRSFSRIAKGSAAVAQRRGDGQVWVYYEGDIYGRPDGREPTIEEFVGYAKTAAGRAIERYPTVAFFVLPSWDGLDVVGYVDGSTYEVQLLPCRGKILEQVE